MMWQKLQELQVSYILTYVSNCTQKNWKLHWQLWGKSKKDHHWSKKKISRYVENLHIPCSSIRSPRMFWSLGFDSMCLKITGTAKPVGFPTQLVKLSTLGCKAELAGKLTKLSYKTAKEMISGTPRPPERTFCLEKAKNSRWYEAECYVHAT